MHHRSFLFCSIASIQLLGSCSGQPPAQDGTGLGPVLIVDRTDTTVALRFDPPHGFERPIEPAGSFGDHLRQLPLLPAGTQVHLFDGTLKYRQDVHAAVIDMSVGNRDLQQCADAVMRLRAEYLFANNRKDEIAFAFTSGYNATWKRWRQGERIKVQGNKCAWVRSGTPDTSHAQLLRYLGIVFSYAGTLSLQRELDHATPNDMSAADLRIGDVFIQGGSPGHAVIIVDKAYAPNGRICFLLAQSYMPAQQIHVLKNTRQPELGAWFMLEEHDRLYTPEWTFDWADRRRWP